MLYIFGRDNLIKMINEPTYEELLKENKELKLELSGYRQAILNDKEMLGLKQENQKYKEVIDKLKNKTKENIENAKCEITTLTIGDKAYYQYIEKILATMP